MSLELPSHVPITLLSGPIGAGKSHVARAIAARDAAVVLATDAFFRDLFLADMPMPPDMQWVLERIARCEGVIKSLAAQLVVAGGSVVLDVGLATRADRVRFSEWSASVPGMHRFVLVDAPLEVRRARVEERSRAAAQIGELPVSPEVFALTDQRYEMPSPEECS